jgi:hypothetical protein
MNEKPDKTLSEFGRSIIALAETLQSNPDFGVIEQIFIENHMHILQSAYGTWQRRNKANKPSRMTHPG